MLKDVRPNYSIYIKSLEIGSHVIVWKPERVTCYVYGIQRLPRRKKLTDEQIKKYFDVSDFVAEVCDENGVWYLVSARKVRANG